jgi:hypothetical protein
MKVLEVPAGWVASMRLLVRPRSAAFWIGFVVFLGFQGDKAQPIADFLDEK